MDFDRVAWSFALPFIVMWTLMAIERALMRRGSIAAMRFAIPIGGWSENVGVEIPTSIAPSRFPATDDLAPGTAYDATVAIRTRWFNESLIAFWDEKAPGVGNTWGLIVTSLLAIDRSGGGSGTVLSVRRYVRVLPGLTVIAAVLAFALLPSAFAPPWQFLALVGVTSGGFTLVRSVLAVRKVRPIYEEISAELVHRATTGRPTIDSDNPLPDFGGGGSIGDLFG